MNTTNKKYVWVLAVIVLIILGAVAIRMNRSYTGSPISVPTVIEPATSTSPASTSTAAVSLLLEKDPYVETKVGSYRINLPKNWVKKGTATDSVSPWITDTSFSDKADMQEFPKVEMKMLRFDLTTKDPRATTTVEVARGLAQDFKAEGFSNFLAAENGKKFPGYKITENRKLSINGRDIYRFDGTYVGQTSKKVVIDTMYVAMLSDAYYILRIQGYAEDVAVMQGAIDASINTLVITK